MLHVITLGEGETIILPIKIKSVVEEIKVSCHVKWRARTDWAEFSRFEGMMSGRVPMLMMMMSNRSPPPLLLFIFTHSTEF